MWKTIKTRLRYTAFGVVLATIGLTGGLQATTYEIHIGHTLLSNRPAEIVKAEADSLQLASMMENAIRPQEKPPATEKARK